MGSNDNAKPPLPPIFKSRSFITDKSNSIGLLHERVTNVLKIHHHSTENSIIALNQIAKSVTLNGPSNGSHSYLNSKLQKNFLFDELLTKDFVTDTLLTNVVRNVVFDKENLVVISLNRRVKKHSKCFNQKFLESILKIIFEQLEKVKISNDTEKERFSIRISALEIAEESDRIANYNRQNESNYNSENDENSEEPNLHRTPTLESANEFVKGLFDGYQVGEKKHILSTIHIYRQSSITSAECLTTLSCAKIHFVQLDMTKTRNQYNCLSLPILAKFFTLSINHQDGRIDKDNRFQSLLHELLSEPSVNVLFITHISAKEKHFTDTHQLLQFCGRIQRLKVKLKKHLDNRELRRSLISGLYRPNISNRSSFRNSGKFSDTEVASNSEMSCAETVIFLGEQHRGNSDDESRLMKHFRAAFISSDSDSGYKELHKYQSSDSQCGTIVNRPKRCGHPRTNALVWPKSAIKNAKAALMKGEEMWVDGPNAVSKENTLSVTASTPETICETVSPGGTSMKNQETQYESSKQEVGTDTRNLSDISEYIEDIESVRKYSEDRYRNSSLNRSDVLNVSRWINDVNQLTSNSPLLSQSMHENIQRPRYFMPVQNDSINSHSYQYYDPVSQSDYNSFPRMYSPVQGPNNPPIPVPQYQHPLSYSFYYDPLLVDIPEKAISRSFSSTDKSVQSVKYSSVKEKPKTKTKNPLKLLKKTFLRSQCSKKKAESPDPSTESNYNIIQTQEVKYLMPVVQSPDESSESSSESECNEWFRNVKTFKTKNDTLTKYVSLRPPSAPLPSGKVIVTTKPLCTSRQRSSSSGYGSVATKDSEISSYVDSTSDQSIQSTTKNQLKQSISFSHNPKNEIDQDTFSERCEILVKQEKAILLMQNQELMIKEFYETTRPLLTTDESKYTLKASVLCPIRLQSDAQYLEELEEDTNVIRDSIAFYKSLVHLESSFLTSPNRSRKCMN